MSIPLAARHVSHTYGRVVALDDVSLEVEAGSVVALVGQSGSGKTTLLRCFNRLVEPQRGEIIVDGAATAGIDPVALRRRLGYVQQRGGLLPHWTVVDNVSLVLRMLDRPRAARDAAAAHALSLVGLEPREYLHRFPHELSGGQQQRVALARALAGEPKAILLDEPFGALDAITRTEVAGAFDGARRRLGLTAVIVTHDLSEAARLADEIVVMRAGRIEQCGTIGMLRDTPATSYVRNLVGRAIATAHELLA